MDKRILVVDDSATIRQSVRMVLEGAGYRVEAANDGEDALKCLASGVYDLMITDIHMPKLDGLELTERVRKTAATAKLPVIVLTTESGERMKSRGREVGANGWIVKPFKPVQLLKLMELTFAAV